MDRFIAWKFSIATLVLKLLKSNMDRFIDYLTVWTDTGDLILKSNMDRFIAQK